MHVGLKKPSGLGRNAPTMNRQRQGGLQIKSCVGQPGHHAIWRAVKILSLTKATDSGRNIDVNQNVLVVQ